MTIGTMSFTIDRTLQLMTRAERRGHPQAPFYVVVVTSDSEGSQLVEEVGRSLAAADPRAFAFTIVDGGARVLDVGAGVAFSRDDEFALAYALTAAGGAPKIALVRGALEDGTSTRWFADEKVAIVSLAEWDKSAASMLQAFLAYQMVVQASRHLRPQWDPSAAVHPDRRGCWGDRLAGRDGIESQLDAAELCDECRRLYEGAGVDVAQLRSLLGVVRELAQRGAGVLK